MPTPTTNRTARTYAASPATVSSSRRLTEVLPRAARTPGRPAPGWRTAW
jgi:hypothetical protein